MGCWDTVVPGCLRNPCSLLCSAFQLLYLSNSMPQLRFYFLSPLICLSTEKKKWWSVFFNLYLDVYFSFDAKQWIPSCKFQFLRTIKPDLGSRLTCATSVSCKAQLSGLGSSQGETPAPSSTEEKALVSLSCGRHWGKKSTKEKELHPCSTDLCHSPNRIFWEPRCYCHLQWARVPHVEMMRRLQFSKAALAPVPQLQKQSKAPVIPWLVKKISQCKMAFLSLA